MWDVVNYWFGCWDGKLAVIRKSIFRRVFVGSLYGNRESWGRPTIGSGRQRRILKNYGVGMWGRGRDYRQGRGVWSGVGWYFRPSFHCSTRGAEFLGTIHSKYYNYVVWLIDSCFSSKMMAWWVHFVCVTKVSLENFEINNSKIKTLISFVELFKTQKLKLFWLTNGGLLMKDSPKHISGSRQIPKLGGGGAMTPRRLSPLKIIIIFFFFLKQKMESQFFLSL